MMRMRFGGCELDVVSRRLMRGAREIHLSPKAFELVRVLVESRPRAVSKAELLERVWPEVFVSDASLARAVNEVRVGLGARNRRLIRTVYGYGYAFADNVDGRLPAASGATSSAPICSLTNATSEFPLREGHQIAGRDRTADIRLESPLVSRRHARFTARGASVTVEDLQSKNGTFVGGTQITTPVPLKRGDEVRIGPFTLVFSIERIGASTETEVNSRSGAR